MASYDTSKTIILKGCPQIREGAATASEAIMPGMLVEFVAAGTVSKQSTADAASNLYAIEQDYAGVGIDTAYADGERVQIASCSKGDNVLATLTTAQTIAIGDQLEAAGDGTLTALAAGIAIATATEAVTTTGATARIKVEVL
jgi:hypothetical protein